MKVVAQEARRRFRRRFLWLTGFAAIAAAAILFLRHEEAPRPTAQRPAAVPVTVTTTSRQNVPVLLQGLGTVQAFNTIAIHSQIDGKLVAVDFVEGQQVHAGDTLAVIDQRALKAAVVRQQLRRIAGIEHAVSVEPVPGDQGGLGWRTRVKFAVGKDGRAGLYQHSGAHIEIQFEREAEAIESGPEICGRGGDADFV